MAKIIKPLSAMKVEAAKPQDKEYYLFDGDNLRIKITPLGSKIWIYFFEWEGKRKKVTIGNFRKSPNSKEIGYKINLKLQDITNMYFSLNIINLIKILKF